MKYQKLGYHVVFVGAPLFKDLQRQTSVKHARRRKHDHWTWIVDVRTLKRLQEQRHQSKWVEFNATPVSK